MRKAAPSNVLAIFSAFMFLTCSSTIAQQTTTPLSTEDVRQADSSHTTVLPDIVVSANRIPLTLLRIPAAVQTLQVSNSPSALYHSVADLAATIPGLRAYATGNAWGNQNVDVRGFYGGGQAQYLMVTYDGIPLNSISSGLVDWTDMNLAELSRMEAVKGPASAQYGDFGFGGLLALYSKTPLGPLGGRFGVTFASDDAYAVNLNLSGRRSNIGFTLVPSVVTSKGWREHSELRSQRVLCTATQELSPKVGLSYLLSFGHTREELPGALTRAQMQTDRTRAARENVMGKVQPDRNDVTQFIAGASANVKLSSVTELRPVAYFKTSSADNIVTITSSLSHKPDIWAGGIDLSLGNHGKLLGREFKLVGGTDFEYGHTTSKYSALDHQFNPVALITSGRGHRTIASGYLHGLYYLTSQLYLAAGARVDHTETGFDYDSALVTQSGKKERFSETALSPKGAVGGQFSKNITAYASVAGAFKTPTFVHLFDSPPAYSPYGYVVISSDSLRALRGTEYELGVRWIKPGSFYVSLDCFSYEIRNEIEFDMATFHYTNVGKSRHRGFELSLITMDSTDVNSELSFAYNDAVYRQGPYLGKQINGVPQVSLHYRATWSPVVHFRISGTCDWRWTQYIDEANRYQVGDYAIISLDSDLLLGPVKVAVAVQNVGDQQYVCDGYVLSGTDRYFPGPGQTFTASVQTTF